MGFSMGNSFAGGMMGGMMMGSGMYPMMYEQQQQQQLMIFIIVFVMIALCACCGLGLCWFCYNKDEEKSRRRDDYRDQARQDEMALKTIQICANRPRRSRHHRRSSW